MSSAWHYGIHDLTLCTFWLNVCTVVGPPGISRVFHVNVQSLDGLSLSLHVPAVVDLSLSAGVMTISDAEKGNVMMMKAQPASRPDSCGEMIKAFCCELMHSDFLWLSFRVQSAVRVS